MNAVFLCIFVKMYDDDQSDTCWLLLCLHFVLFYLQLEEENLICLLKLHLNEQHRLNRSLPVFFLLFDDFPGSCKDSTIVSIFGYTADSLLQRLGMVLFIVGDVLDIVCSLLPIDTKAVAAMF